MSPKEVKDIIRKYRQGLEKIFGDSIERVILFGSFARGAAREDSDIDFLCVLSGPFDYGEAIKKTSELTARISLEHDVVLSRVFVSEQDFSTKNLPFFMNVRREGVSA